MKGRIQKCTALLVFLVFLITCGHAQPAIAQDAETYTAGKVQKYAVASLENTTPDIGNGNMQTVDVINGTVKFTLKGYGGSKYDILRSDNGGQYVKLTDFLLNSVDFEDKYVLDGHTYYYMVVAYDANGAVLSNNGPYKAVAREGASASSKIILLQLDNPNASVNGVKYTLSVRPFIKDGRTMVPLRFISEALGAQVDWLESERKIAVKLNGNTINLWIGKSEAKINNETVYMDVPAMISNDTTLVPLRFVIENLKLTVDFNDKTKEITISGGDTGVTPPQTTPAPQPVPPPQPTGTNENTLKSIVKSSNKYYGVSSDGSTETEYSITFSDYKEQSGGFGKEQTAEFKGKIEWNGYNFYDFIEGRIEGDQLIFRQVSRYQEDNLTALLNCLSTMKIEGSNKVSGTWIVFPSRETGTIWFEFTPFAPAQSATQQAKYSGSYDSKGFPAGKATVEFGNNTTFAGDVKVEKNNFIATGVITYPDGSKAIGRYVNGKPDGLTTIVYPDKKSYLIDFKYGEPVQYFIAKTPPAFKAEEIEMFKSDGIADFRADDIAEFHSDSIAEFHSDSIVEFHAEDIDKYYADSIEPYEAKIIEKYQAQPVERNSTVVTLDKYQAEVAALSPPGTSKADIPVGGFTSPDYMNPLVQMWTAHMTALPYLINNNMVYRY